MMNQLTADMMDDIGGWHPDPALRKWEVGSCFENEGQYLYRAVREMQPDVIVEVGRWRGCSASHLALACKHNGKGRVYSIDHDPASGQMIPDDLRPFIVRLDVNVFDLNWREHVGLPIDILLEDGAHTTGFTEGVLRKLVLDLEGSINSSSLSELDLSPRLVICHDFRHPTCQETVYVESQRLLGEPTEVFFEPPSDCGYGIWRRTPAR